jgi:hypothetical protein
MHELASTHSLTLPIEARTWWRWRDGIARDEVLSPRERELGPNEVFLPLQEALEHRAWWQQRTSDLIASDQSDAADGWDPAWLPVARVTNGVIVCDCSVPDGSPTPIRLIDPGLGEEARMPRARSFGEWVTWWLEALDGGAWVLDEHAATWTRVWQRLRPELERSGLV